MIGKQLGNYKLLGKIGQGGMGDVYKAMQLSLNRVVAIKTLPPQLAHNQLLVQRFRREAEAAAKLDHPNIITIYEVGEIDGLHFFSMRYVDGGDLKALIQRNGALIPPKTIRIALQVCYALEYAHHEGIIHRDIKPSNILIDKKGVVQVTDFGIAKVADLTSLTVPEVALGTPEYISPEKAEGKSVDARTDIYSLGVVLYEMLTGEVPFKGDTPVSIAIKHITEEPVPPTRLNNKVGGELEKIVQKAMAKNPTHRYSSISEMIQDLRKAGACERIDVKLQKANSPTVQKELASKARPNRQKQSSEIPVNYNKKSHLWVWGLVISVAILAATFFLLPRQDTDEQQLHTLLSQAESFFQTDSLDKALEVYQKVLVVDPGNVTAVRGRERIAWKYRLIGDEEYARGDYENARHNYLRAAGLLPNSPELERKVKECDTKLSAISQEDEMGTKSIETSTPLDQSVEERSGVGNATGVESIMSPEDARRLSEMVLIPEGWFVMGSPENEGNSDEHPQHRVWLDAFYIDKYEVTNFQFREFVVATGYVTDAERKGRSWVWIGNDWKEVEGAYWRAPLGPGSTTKMDHSVVHISWNDAQAYARWAGKRLPTEAEWEKAARGSDGRRFPWGNDWDPYKCNNWQVGPHFVTAVGTYDYGESPFSIMDMAGNVWEWVADGYDSSYYKQSPEKNPQGPVAISHRVLRGGSWLSEKKQLRSTARNHYPPDFTDNTIGFRCAR